jgi:hypothetical protein
MKSLIPLVLLLFAGCANLHQDPSPAAIDSGYPTAEFTACGQLWHGIGGCAVALGGDANKTVDLSVQGYYQGTVTADGEACGISGFSQSYDSNGAVSIPVGALTKDCFITFTVTPTYPQHTVVPVSGFRGYLLVVAKTADMANWNFEGFTVSGQWQRTWLIDAGDAGPLQVNAAGCGLQYSASQNPAAGYAVLPLQNMTAGVPNPCALDGYIVSPKFQNVYFDAIIAQYSTNFSPLPIPDYSIDTGNSKINVTADPAVGVVSVDANWNEDNTGSFDFDPTQPHVLRILSSMGRSVLGIWEPAAGNTQGAFKWLQ